MAVLTIKWIRANRRNFSASGGSAIGRSFGWAFPLCAMAVFFQLGRNR